MKMSNSSKTEKGEVSQHNSAGRGGRLARRARSFKEDFFGKISQMRTPGTQRSSSPHKKSKGSGKGNSGSPNTCGVSGDFMDGVDKRKGEKDVDCVLYHVNQLGKSLSYLEDTVRKGIPDMLPGSVSVILDTVMNIQSSLRKCSPALSDQSSELLSATNQVYQSLAALVRVSDEIFLQRNETSKDNVTQMVKNVREAVQSLVQLCMDRQQNKENSSRVSAQSPVPPVLNGFCSPKMDKKDGEDSSLEVPLTPREKEILEQTSAFSLPIMPSSNDPQPGQRTSLLHHSTSSDSILSSACGSQRGSRDVTGSGVTGPPPKPPFPLHQGSLDSASPFQNSHGFVEAPPLPPKKRSIGGGTFISSQCRAEHFLASSRWTAETNGTTTSMNGSACHQSAGFLLENRIADMSLTPAFDWINSLRHSPESLSLSKTSVCSLDSNLNHSADDLLMMGNTSRNRLFHQSSTTSARVTNSSAGASTTGTVEGSHQTFSFSSSSKKTTLSYSLSSSTGNSIDDLAGGQSPSFLLSGANGSQDLGSSNPSVNLSSCSPPPALPVKMRAGRGRAMSQYDNVPQFLVPDSEPESGRGSLEEDQCQMRHSQSMFHYPGCLQSSTSLSSGVIGQLCPRHPPIHFGSCNALEDGKPPPLPPKKKNIMAYMQTFGSYSQPAEGEFFRHSLTTYQMVQAEWQRVELMTTFPQQPQQFHHHTTTTASSSATSFATSSLVSSSDDSVFSKSSHESWDQSFGDENFLGQVSPTKMPPALPPKRNRMSNGKFPETPAVQNSLTPSTTTLALLPTPMSPLENKALTFPEGENSLKWSKDSDGMADEQILNDINVEHHLVFKQPDEEGLDVRGGPIDALIAHTTRIPLTKDGKTCEKKLDSPSDNSILPVTSAANNTNMQGKACAGSNYLYLEAFLTTYRTFVSPFELVQKLIYRHNRFIHMQDKRKHIARNAFGVIVQVVDDFCLSDLDSGLVSMVMDFIQTLVSGGDLPQAKVLHMRLVDKHRQQQQEMLLPSPFTSLCLGDVSTQQALLLDFKSEHLAEQMTLLDAHIFQRIEIPEVLLYAREQKEELSPNLTKFTEHFNNMSYWARSRILEQDEAKERERFVVKFIKIMKCLRKLKNFNSYLAILSALDSAPIRRLEWQRNITEGLKEYCALIDSSSSFRAYRLALAETQPPCIPYIGLILQDLTFVHIGNNDLLPDGKTNFAKRWQQFNILQNMKRFRKCQYAFKKDEQIVAFFNNFDNYLCEESMWQISESIKPRGGKKKQDP